MNAKLASVNLEVADPQRAKAFYIDILGMTERLDRSRPPGFVYLESSGADITLATPERDDAAGPSRTMELGFEVPDVAALRTRLEEHGVTGFTTQNMAWGDVIEGHDPDGHRIIIYRLTGG